MGGNWNRGDGENGNENAVLEWEWVGMGIEVMGKMGMRMRCWNENGCEWE